MQQTKWQTPSKQTELFDIYKVCLQGLAFDIQVAWATPKCVEKVS